MISNGNDQSKRVTRRSSSSSTHLPIHLQMYLLHHLPFFLSTPPIIHLLMYLLSTPPIHQSDRTSRRAVMETLHQLEREPPPTPRSNSWPLPPPLPAQGPSSGANISRNPTASQEHGERSRPSGALPGSVTVWRILDSPFGRLQFRNTMAIGWKVTQKLKLSYFFFVYIYIYIYIYYNS